MYCIVQGSAIGPPQLYKVHLNGDLELLCADSILIKYAHDITLLIAEHSAIDILAEFSHIQACNKLP